jgi:HK97 family phage major capsid protein
MRRFWNFIESENSRELRLDGAIAVETWWGDEVTPAAFKSELNAGTGNITVWINSPGGDVFAAAQIYNALKEYSEKSRRVTVKIDGLAASAASVVAMAGDEVLMSPVSYMVIHNPATVAIGDALRGEVISNALKIGSDPEGGYLVPDEFEKKLVKALEERNVMRRLANIIRTKHGERQIPVVATKGTAAWVDEEALIPESDSTFGQVTLGAHKVATMIKVSGELLNDSAFSIEEYVANEFARRIAAKEEEAFFVGDGNKKPTGILAATGGAEVGATAASMTAITHDDVLDLFYSLKSPYREKAVFIANDLTVKQLRKLKDSAGQYLWTPSIKDGTPDMIIGRPIYTSPYVPEIAAGAKTLVFGDYSYYWIADRQSRTFQRLNEMFATTGQIGFIATQRVDGKLILPEAVRVLQMKAE